MSSSIQWRFWRYSYTVCRYAPFSGNPACCYIQSFQQGCHVLRIGTTCLMTTGRNLWAHHRICIASTRRPTQTFVTCWGDITTVWRCGNVLIDSWLARHGGATWAHKVHCKPSKSRYGKTNPYQAIYLFDQDSCKYPINIDARLAAFARLRWSSDRGHSGAATKPLILILGTSFGAMMWVQQWVYHGIPGIPKILLENHTCCMKSDQIWGRTDSPSDHVAWWQCSKAVLNDDLWCVHFSMNKPQTLVSNRAISRWTQSLW